ncbi:MAG TPA: hypothetical protein VF595_01075 [Tepidisphaeraceae bacterium]|jgi:hypothetical protein
MSQKIFVEQLEGRQVCASWASVSFDAARAVFNTAAVVQVVKQAPAYAAYKVLGHYGRGVEVIWNVTNQSRFMPPGFPGSGRGTSI